MIKRLLFLFLGLFVLSPIVKADEIKFTSASTKEITIAFTTAEAGTVTVDWGNGTPVSVQVTQTDIDGAATEVSGTPSGEITVSGNNITVFDCNTTSLTALDVTKATSLKKLSFNGNALTNVDLSQNTALYSLHAENNLGLQLDVTKNTALGLLYCNDSDLSSLDVTKNTLLTTLNFNNNKIVSIDLSKNTALKSIYALNNLIEVIDLSKNTALTYVSFNTNKLTSLDVTGLDALKSIFATNNSLTSIIGANNAAKIGTVNITGNKLNLATLPQPEALRTQFNYAPQQAYVIAESIEEGKTLDLSSQNNVKGILTAPVATVYTWATESGTALVAGTDYKEENGVFTFLKGQTEKVVCSMSTTAFPKFTTTNIFKTTPIQVIGLDKIKLTSSSTKEITISFTTAEAGIVTVDWGNGTPIDVQVTQTDMDGIATAVTGVPSGEIIVSGKNIIVLDCSSASLTALDVTKATNLKKLSFNGNSLTNVDLSQNTALYSLHAENNLGLQLDVTKNTALGLLYSNDNGMETLDVTNNLLLTTLNFNNNKIVSIDLSKNTALKSIYALNNLIEAIDLSKNTALTYISFNTNKLTKLDVTGLDALKSIFATNNNLTELIGANNAAKVGTVNITGNKLNLATLPQPEALRTQFNYAPQQAYVIPASIEEGTALDLSSQNNVKGILTAPVATVYTWVTESNDTLAVGTDYTEANGVFTFLKAQTEKLVCSMTTTAFPKFTGASVFKTTPIEVKAVFVGDEIKLTSSSTKEITISLTTAEAGTVTVDWGNGTPVDVEITQTDMDGIATGVTGVPSGEIIVRGKNIIVLDCSSASLTALDVTKAANLKKLSFNGNTLTSVDLSQNTALYSLHAENNLGLELDVTKNTALGLLYCNDNGMETLDVTNNLLLTTLNFNNNKISTLDFSKNTALKSIYALNNLLESVDLSKNTALTYVSFNTNKLTSLDVTGLDALKSIFATNNNLTELIGANNAAKVGTVNITGNKLNLATLPQPEALRTQFNYAPQQAYVIPESIEEGVELDLSSQNNVKGILTAPVATVYTWVTESNDTLAVGTDYTEANGVFTFLKAQTEKLVCSMTTTAFPKFTGASVFKTTAIEVKGSSSLNDAGVASVVVRSEKGGVVISNLAGQEFVRVINARGLDVYSTVNVSDVLSVELSAGLYIVIVDEVAHKVLVK